MKLKLTIVLAFLPLSILRAQNYSPMLDSISNTWHFTANWIPVRVNQTPAPNCDYGQFSFGTSIYFTDGDTIISNVSYKIINHYETFVTSNICRFGYMREDTIAKKIYFIANDFSPEKLIYDFSLNQGDQITLQFLFPGFFPDGTYVVDTVRMINTVSGQRRMLDLLPVVNPFNPPLQWIEGVGCPGAMVPAVAMNSYGGLFQICNDAINRTNTELMTCFEHSNQRIYLDSCARAYAANNWCFNYQDSCNYYNICGSISENTSISQVSVNPNPASEKAVLNITCSNPETAFVSFYDIAGRLVKSVGNVNLQAGENQVEIDLMDFYPGTAIAVLQVRGIPYSINFMVVR